MGGWAVRGVRLNPTPFLLFTEWCAKVFHTILALNMFTRNRRRLEEAEKRLAALEDRYQELWDAIEPMELKYRELYETARRNLAKLAQRAKEQEDDGDTSRQNGEDPVVKARALLLQRKLNRG